MADNFDQEEFQRRLKEQLETSRIAFDGIYKEELIQLSGLSRTQIDKITGGPIDLQKYDELIAVIKEASKANLDQANLVAEIRKLGHIAVTIAKKIPAFSALL